MGIQEAEAICLHCDYSCCALWHPQDVGQNRNQMQSGIDCFVADGRKYINWAHRELRDWHGFPGSEFEIRLTDLYWKSCRSWIPEGIHRGRESPPHLRHLIWRMSIIENLYRIWVNPQTRRYSVCNSFGEHPRIKAIGIIQDGASIVCECE